MPRQRKHWDPLENRPACCAAERKRRVLNKVRKQKRNKDTDSSYSYSPRFSTWQQRGVVLFTGTANKSPRYHIRGFRLTPLSTTHEARLPPRSMQTTPYHYSIAACSLTPSNDGKNNEILYRGSIPAARNLPFIRRLGLRTIVYQSKKELEADDGMVIWAKKRGVVLRWVKAEEMAEESLGVGKTEVGEVLKVCLPSSFAP